MAIRFFLILFFCRCNVFSQGTEAQRKYRPENLSSFTEFIKNSGASGEFKSRYHSDYIATDVYFDTPENDIFQSGLSLRFRKRVISEDSAVYSFQLKTEMVTSDGVRTEVDEPELSFYQVILPEYTGALVNLLDSVFYYCSDLAKIHSVDYRRHVSTLSAWMKQKAGAPIAPFQKLKFLFPDIFTDEKIGSMMPVCIGRSKRLRSHIYIDLNDYENQYGRLFRNPEGIKEKLTFFETNESFIWVMESSLDSAQFSSLLNSDAGDFVISEYEVECKYQFSGTALAMINEFERQLMEKFNLQKTMDSKFRQSMLSFGN